MNLIPEELDEEFANRLDSLWNYIVERQLIWYKRNILKTERPWSSNKTLQKFKFCNVYRELDATSLHLFDKIKPHFSPKIKLFNIIILRLFNNRVLFDKYLPLQDPDTFNRQTFVDILEPHWDKGLWNPAYLVVTSGGWTKETHKLDKRKHVQFSYVLEHLCSDIDEYTIRLQNARTGDEALKIIRESKFIGEFFAYQIALDLSYLSFFRNDLNEDNILVVGPGAIQGISLLCSDNPKLGYLYDCDVSRDDAVDTCIHLCKIHLENIQRVAKEKGYEWEDICWKESPTYPRLTLSAIEFNLCEWRKLQYRLEGKGRVRHYVPYQTH